MTRVGTAETMVETADARAADTEAGGARPRGPGPRNTAPGPPNTAPGTWHTRIRRALRSVSRPGPWKRGPVLAALALLLFPLDVAVRRLRWPGG